MAIPAFSLKTTIVNTSSRMRRSQCPETPARKGSRRRLVRSCSECSRRKQKVCCILNLFSLPQPFTLQILKTVLTNSQCNRNWPCNNCAGSRAHLCRYDHTVKRCTPSASKGPGELSPPSSSKHGLFHLIMFSNRYRR